MAPGRFRWLGYHKPIRNQLASKGFEVLDSFSCRGFDTVGPFGFIGGINRGRPRRPRPRPGRGVRRTSSRASRGLPGLHDQWQAKSALPAILALVRGLVAEVHPHASPPSVTLDSPFDDLGIGSLELAELLLRVQDKFGVALPPHILAQC